MTMERGLSFGSRGPQSDFARLCWRVRIQNNNHQRHATTQGVSHAAVKHPARFRGLRAPHALYCAHQPNSAVKPTPTSSACGCPPCFALRRGLPRALGGRTPHCHLIENLGVETKRRKHELVSGSLKEVCSVQRTSEKEGILVFRLVQHHHQYCSGSHRRRYRELQSRSGNGVTRRDLHSGRVDPWYSRVSAPTS